MNNQSNHQKRWTHNCLSFTQSQICCTQLPLVYPESIFVVAPVASKVEKEMKAKVLEFDRKRRQFTIWMCFRHRYSVQLLLAVAVLVALCSSSHAVADAFSLTQTLNAASLSSSDVLLFAKRNKNQNRYDGDNDPNRWYDSVGDDATPDKVFWEEMDRQRLFNQIGAGSGNENEYFGTTTSTTTNGGRNPVAVTSTSNLPPNTGMGAAANGRGVQGMVSTGVGAGMIMEGGRVNEIPGYVPPKPTLEEQKSADATLAEYSLYQVSDNWLNERLQEQFFEPDTLEQEEEEDITELPIEEQTQRLEEQLEALPDGFGDTLRNMGDDEVDEPWDHYGLTVEKKQQQQEDIERKNVFKVPAPTKGSDFFLDDDLSDEEERELRRKYDEELWERLEGCQVASRRLQRAKSSPRAKEFFQRKPEAREGYDTMWVSAVDPACYPSLKGNLRNYGIQFADNFGDFEDRAPEDSFKYSIEDLASMKARKVYEVTGLPCIASRTSFEIEPVPPSASSSTPTVGPGGSNTQSFGFVSNNPRVLSGYKVNDIAMHVDYLVEALQPVSEPDRVTRLTSCLCYYDGDVEIFEFGVVDVDLMFCHSLRTYIPMSQAIHNMVQTLQFTFGLEYQKWLKTRVNDVISSSASKASLKLRDRVLKDGKVLPNDIIDVSKFMDSQIDVNLMDDCAQELATRFMEEKPTKILTVATTGLVIALPMAKYLQVPVVYARKERNVVMADTFQAGYSSKTVGKNRELLVSKSHLDMEDRVLVVDDFLSSGAAQEALLRIISEAEATAVGVGVLLEKVYDSGRQSLSGFDIPIQSLCRVASVQEGVIQLVEEEGFVDEQLE